MLLKASYVFLQNSAVTNLIETNFGLNSISTASIALFKIIVSIVSTSLQLGVDIFNISKKISSY